MGLVGGTDVVDMKQEEDGLRESLRDSVLRWRAVYLGAHSHL